MSRLSDCASELSSLLLMLLSYPMLSIVVAVAAGVDAVVADATALDEGAGADQHLLELAGLLERKHLRDARDSHERGGIRRWQELERATLSERGSGATVRP